MSGVNVSAGNDPADDYSPLSHGMSLLTLVIVSVLGVAQPKLTSMCCTLSDAVKLRLDLIQLSFGAGIVLATAFVHILPDAFADLAVVNSFDGLAGVIAMTFGLLTWMLETLLGHIQQRFQQRHIARPDDQPAIVQRAGHKTDNNNNNMNSTAVTNYGTAAAPASDTQRTLQDPLLVRSSATSKLLQHHEVIPLIRAHSTQLVIVCKDDLILNCSSHSSLPRRRR